MNTVQYVGVEVVLYCMCVTDVIFVLITMKQLQRLRPKLSQLCQINAGLIMEPQVFQVDRTDSQLV